MEKGGKSRQRSERKITSGNRRRVKCLQEEKGKTYTKESERGVSEYNLASISQKEQRKDESIRKRSQQIKRNRQRDRKRGSYEEGLESAEELPKSPPDRTVTDNVEEEVGVCSSGIDSESHSDVERERWRAKDRKLDYDGRRHGKGKQGPRKKREIVSRRYHDVMPDNGGRTYQGEKGLSIWRESRKEELEEHSSSCWGTNAESTSRIESDADSICLKRSPRRRGRVRARGICTKDTHEETERSIGVKEGKKATYREISQNYVSTNPDGGNGEGHVGSSNRARSVSTLESGSKGDAYLASERDSAAFKVETDGREFVNEPVPAEFCVSTIEFNECMKCAYQVFEHSKIILCSGSEERDPRDESLAGSKLVSIVEFRDTRGLAYQTPAVDDAILRRQTGLIEPLNEERERQEHVSAVVGVEKRGNAHRKPARDDIALTPENEQDEPQDEQEETVVGNQDVNVEEIEGIEQTAYQAVMQDDEGDRPLTITSQRTMGEPRVRTYRVELEQETTYEKVETSSVDSNPKPGMMRKTKQREDVSKDTKRKESPARERQTGALSNRTDQASRRKHLKAGYGHPWTTETDREGCSLTKGRAEYTKEAVDWSRLVDNNDDEQLRYRKMNRVIEVGRTIEGSGDQVGIVDDKERDRRDFVNQDGEVGDEGGLDESRMRLRYDWRLRDKQDPEPNKYKKSHRKNENDVSVRNDIKGEKAHLAGARQTYSIMQLTPNSSTMHSSLDTLINNSPSSRIGDTLPLERAVVKAGAQALLPRYAWRAEENGDRQPFDIIMRALADYRYQKSHGRGRGAFVSGEVFELKPKDEARTGETEPRVFVVP